MRINRSETRKEISAFCKRLVFSQKAIELCENEASVSQEIFLHKVMKSELANRQESRRRRLLREAAFPVYKTFLGYEFNNLKLPSNLSREELITCNFVKDKRNILLYGHVGTGKTHLATALGITACELDMVVRFFTTTELVVRLSEAFRNGS